MFLSDWRFYCVVCVVVLYSGGTQDTVSSLAFSDLSIGSSAKSCKTPKKKKVVAVKKKRGK